MHCWNLTSVCQGQRYSITWTESWYLKEWRRFFSCLFSAPKPWKPYVKKCCWCPVWSWLGGCCICILTALKWVLSLHLTTFPLDIIIRGNSSGEAWPLLSYWFKVYCLTRDCEGFHLVQKVLNAYYSEVLKYYQLGLFVSSPWSSEGPASPCLICFSSETILGSGKLIHTRLLPAGPCLFLLYGFPNSKCSRRRMPSFISVLCPSSLSDVPQDFL